MKRVEAAPITRENFKAYGSVYRLEAKNETISFTDTSPMSRPLRLGITRSGACPYICRKMERHISTQELLFVGDKPMVLVVSNSDPEGVPNMEHMAAFLLKPGDLAVLNRGIWHDACRGAAQNTSYYFMANNNGDPRETEWVDVYPSPVEICSPVGKAENETEISISTPLSHEHETGPGVTLLNVTANEMVTGDGWQCWMTDDVCLDYPARFGMATGLGGPRTKTKTRYTAERDTMLLCGNVPLIVNYRSQLQDLQVAVKLGDALIIHKGTAFSVEILQDCCGYYFIFGEI